jgi:nicotinamidase-related amidase
MEKQLEIEILESIRGIEQELNNLKIIGIDELEIDKTAIIVVDVVNGFINEGSLADKSISRIIPNIKMLLDNLVGAKKLFFLDEHTPESEELKTYPEHCMIGSRESDIVPELKPYTAKNASVITKNSTNGYHAEAFQVWLDENLDDLESIIIVGDCTDICISQFALTLKTVFNEWNMPIRIIVPKNCVDTYDAKAIYHHAVLKNYMALYDMKSNGIEVVEAIADK